MRLADLIQRVPRHAADALTLQREPALPDPRICDFTEDSRTAMPGSIFVARKGHTADGRHFITNAAKDGATAILTDPDSAALVPQTLGLITANDVPQAAARLAEAFYDNPSKQLNLTAVTGTNGKTTVAHLLHQLLNLAHRPAGLIGTVSIDDGKSLSPAVMTTPTASDLSLTLRNMLDNERTHAVIEASSHALHQQRTAALDIDNAVFTNLTGDHLDYHQSTENYAAAKAILFQSLKPDALAVLNADDPHTPRMLRDCAAPHTRTAVLQSPADTHEHAGATIACTTPPTLLGTTIHIDGPFIRERTQPIDAHTTLLGHHNLHNLLQAVTVATHLGLTRQQLQHAIPNLTPPTGRLEPISTAADDITVLIDFAHTDDALHATLAALNAAKPAGSTLTALFGAGGDRDPAKRPRMGHAAATLADRVVVTSDNPRSESPSSIISDILAGMTTHQRHHAQVHADRANAIAHAITTASPNEIILIAGKGHEQTQTLAGTTPGKTRTIPFSDHEHARAALAERRATPQDRNDPPTEPKPAAKAADKP